jgi:hypothetical protein
VTIGVEDTNSGDDEEGDIDSQDDDEVNKSNIILLEVLLKPGTP